MKPCAFANQTLLAHALGTVSQVNKVFSEQYFEVMSNRLRLVNKYSAEFLSSQVALLAALHDIGKAAEKYQLQFDDACKPIKDYTSFRRDRQRSFPIHERMGRRLYQAVVDFVVAKSS